MTVWSVALLVLLVLFVRTAGAQAQADGAGVVIRRPDAAPAVAATAPRETPRLSGHFSRVAYRTVGGWYDPAPVWPTPPVMGPPSQPVRRQRSRPSAVAEGPLGDEPIGPSADDAQGPLDPIAEPLAPDEPCDDCAPGPVPYGGPMFGPFHGYPRWWLRRFLEHARRRGHWRHRPISASWFVGVIWGDDLQGLDFINARVKEDSGFLAGARLGWDWSDYFGGEMRLGFSAIDLQDPLEGFNNDIILWDGSLLFYPTGDTRLRPYVLTGVGLVNVDVATDQSRRLLGMPIGGGVKYRWGNRMALRLELLDNIALPSGSGLETMHNISLTAGLEFRLGGSRRSYWPWEPSRLGW